MKATRLALKACVTATAIPSPKHGAAPRAPGRALRTGAAPAPPASLLPPRVPGAPRLRWGPCAAVAPQRPPLAPRSFPG